jgi:predicted HTH transcriptional regulator
MYTEDDLRTAISLGSESRSTEFKGPKSFDGDFKAKVVRTMLGMANTPDGGVIIVGVDEGGKHRPVPTGFRDDPARDWNYDDIASQVSNYADPYVDFSVTQVQMDGRFYLVIQVSEFDQMPVICMKDYSGTHPILRKGALYVRRRGGRIETVEVPSHTEMRAIIDRAADIQARRLLNTLSDLPIPGGLVNPSKARYDEEAKDLL